MQRIALLLAASAIVASCGGGKQVKSAEPLLGWHAQTGWPGACYYPPAYAQLGPGDRRLARQSALEAMLAQWQGEREDGVSFDRDRVTRFETVLLGQPALIEEVSVENLAQCERAMADGGQTAPWEKWLAAAPDRLTEGQCKYRPLDYQLFDYLDVGRAWQIPANVCEGNKVLIKGSTIDEYRIEDKGPWINVHGDTSRPSLGTKLPCNIEGCYAGMLIARFTGDSGAELIFPVGAERTFVAPEHGRIEVRINDDTYFDNAYRVVGSIGHHTAIEYQGQ